MQTNLSTQPKAAQVATRARESVARAHVYMLVELIRTLVHAITTPALTQWSATYLFGRKILHPNLAARRK